MKWVFMYSICMYIHLYIQRAGFIFDNMKTSCFVRPTEKQNTFSIRELLLFYLITNLIVAAKTETEKLNVEVKIE